MEPFDPNELSILQNMLIQIHKTIYLRDLSILIMSPFNILLLIDYLIPWTLINHSSVHYYLHTLIINIDVD